MRGRLDPFVLALLATAAVASALPAQGTALAVLRIAATGAVALLFGLYGARLRFAETLAGLRHWRLHAAVLGTTFIAFPIAGFAAAPLIRPVLGEDLTTGLLLVCLVPSTVQSAVAYTGLARGNVAGAVVSASVSNIAGVVITPLLVGLLLAGASGAAVDASAVARITGLLLGPFVVGQLLQPRIGDWVRGHARPLLVVDRGSILLVVYLAFSEGRNRDVWSRLSAGQIVAILVACLVLLALAVTWTRLLGRWAGFEAADRTTLLFCGTQKSLASGLPMAAVLFPAATVAVVIVPLMIYHQSQLILSAWLAPRAQSGPDAQPAA